MRQRRYALLVGIPDAIGRYQVVGPLARGGMAELFVCKMLGPSGFERAVVVKRILPHLSDRQAFVDMFLDEARIVAGIRHPNVVHVHELGNDDDGLYLVMEYLDGESLLGLVRRLRLMRRGLPPGLAAYILAETCSGLHAAHELRGSDGLPQNLVHRDVSPQNVLVLYNGQIKVVDFGIATATDRLAKTEAGQVKGKFSYMSPEQCLGKGLDRRSDIFSLGTVLFELTTGNRLFHRENELKTLKAITEEPLIAPSKVVSDYPRVLEKVVMRALARDPNDRYPDALAMRRDLLEAMRALEVDVAADVSLASLMQQLFSDRIEEKHEMLRRIQSGSNLTHIPEAEVDVDVELPGIENASGLFEPTSPTDTTISRSGSATGRWIAAAVALIALAVGGYFGVVFAFPSDEQPTDPPSVATRPAEADPEADLEQEPSALESDVAEPLPQPDNPETEARVTLNIDTRPQGARVFVNGEEIGVAPTAVEWATSSDPVTLELRLRGYETYTEEVVPDVDQRLRLVLERERRGTPRPNPAMSMSMDTGMDLSFMRFD